MATYQSILSKAEDALAFAYGAIPDAGDLIAGLTTYKGGVSSDASFPLIAFTGIEARRIDDNSEPSVAQNFEVSIGAVIMTKADDDTRAEAYAIEGLAEAVLFRSADQIVGQCNLAGVSEFTALQWIPQTISRDFSDDVRTTTLSGILVCASSNLT